MVLFYLLFGRDNMKKILTVMILGILVFSGFGVSALSQENPSFKKTSVFDKFDMVIIAPELFSSIIQPLINHKNSFGINTFLKTTEEIYFEYGGRDEPEQIKYFIKDAIEINNINYVLLIGNEDKLTVRYSYSNNGSAYGDADLFITDLYYADVYDKNGNNIRKPNTAPTGSENPDKKEYKNAFFLSPVA